MAYQIALEQYQGPLDVLLQLIEQEKLNITDISLADITESFLQHLDKVEELYPEELADFLVVATRLLYIKSRVLLPYLIRDDDEPIVDLAEHLKIYKEFRDASLALEQRLSERAFAMPRPVRAAQFEAVEFAPPKRVTTEDLHDLYVGVVDRLETVIKIPQAAIRKAITLKEKITALYTVLRQHQRVQFSALISDSTDRMNVVLTFLAILELVKQNSVSVEQTEQFSDILIVCQETTNAN
ncbi:MAG: ScpA/B protein [uncultured bacterium]|nr:MAG: ScpA/B protein [uncultured bacterium]